MAPPVATSSQGPRAWRCRCALPSHWSVVATRSVPSAPCGLFPVPSRCPHTGGGTRAQIPADDRRHSGSFVDDPRRRYARTLRRSGASMKARQRRNPKGANDTQAAPHWCEERARGRPATETHAGPAGFVSGNARRAEASRVETDLHADARVAGDDADDAGGARAPARAFAVPPGLGCGAEARLWHRDFRLLSLRRPTDGHRVHREGKRRESDPRPPGSPLRPAAAWQGPWPAPTRARLVTSPALLACSRVGSARCTLTSSTRSLRVGRFFGRCPANLVRRKRDEPSGRG